LSVRIVRRDTHRVMPWKNGGGTTAEIAIAPEDADLASGGFDWRLSLARIERDGPFSAFPGIDRTIMLVEGAGMILTAPHGARMVLDRRFVPQDFPGEWAVDCRLRAGPVRDLNLMVNRARVTARWMVLTLDDVSIALPGAAGTLVVHVLDGGATFSGSADLEDAGALATGDTMLAGRDDLVGGARVGGTATLFAAAIDRC
jgi:environmental stress-induced protein Ves